MHKKGCEKIAEKRPKNWSSYLLMVPKGSYDVIGEKTVADAILDRLVHHALRVELFGESIRRRKVKTEFE